MVSAPAVGFRESNAEDKVKHDCRKKKRSQRFFWQEAYLGNIPDDFRERKVLAVLFLCLFVFLFLGEQDNAFVL